MILISTIVYLHFYHSFDEIFSRIYCLKHHNILFTDCKSEFTTLEVCFRKKFVGNPKCKDVLRSLINIISFRELAKEDVIYFMDITSTHLVKTQF